MKTIEVDRAEILHDGDGNDGFRTFLRVDGKLLPECDPPRCERKLTVVIEAHQKVKILAEVRDEPPTLSYPYANCFYEVTYIANDFEMNLGDLYVTTQPDRYPCSTRVNGYEVHARTLTVVFQEGQAVWVDLRFKPQFSDREIGQERQDAID